MEEASVILERHEQRINTLERDISDLKAVQTEIRTMNETLVRLTIPFVLSAVAPDMGSMTA